MIKQVTNTSKREFYFKGADLKKNNERRLKVEKSVAIKEEKEIQR